MRAILHSDANSFFASVEVAYDPSLRGLPVAVCGSVEERHGIVLTKTEQAKRAGVKTGMAIWQARRACPSLVVVEPHYDRYVKYSKFLQDIYSGYTEFVEPFGMDECWLDVTASSRDPYEIAEEIRNRVRTELGITVSIGVSFNKIFAKLGSDMKKPDAVTVITKENFRDTVWTLPVSDLLYCGRATTAKLESRCIHTIGELARMPADIPGRLLGKNGYMLWSFANGLDEARVARFDYVTPAKSVGHGITCVSDITDDEDAHKVITMLCQDIGYKLRSMGLRACGIHLFVRDSTLRVVGWQTPVKPTDDEAKIAAEAYSLYREKYDRAPVRSLTVTAIKLEPSSTPVQLDLLTDADAVERRARLRRSVDAIRDRYGKRAILPALVLDERKMPINSEREIVMPGYMYE